MRAKGAFQAVLVNDVDRLARDVSHLGIVKRDLESQNVSVIFRKLPGEQAQPTIFSSTFWVALPSLSVS